MQIRIWVSKWGAKITILQYSTNILIKMGEVYFSIVKIMELIKLNMHLIYLNMWEKEGTHLIK